MLNRTKASKSKLARFLESNDLKIDPKILRDIEGGTPAQSGRASQRKVGPDPASARATTEQQKLVDGHTDEKK